MAVPTQEQSQAMDFKKEGNAAHQRGEYRQAIYLFSRGLELCPGSSSEHILYSNRSASYCLLEDFERALQDAEMVVRLQPDWPRGYSRKGAALHHLKRYNEAMAAYQRGLELDPTSDVMKKGLEEAQQARDAAMGRPFVSEVRATTKQGLAQATELRQLPDVIWHLEIIKDKIWLADPPKAPFRPRSLFIIDSTRIQMLHMTAHPTRDSITLDELLDFTLQCCFKMGIRPGILEFSDWKLQMVLEKSVQECGIKVRTLSLASNKQKFFEDTIRTFEEKEYEQWKDNPKFAGVLRQRSQKGLLNIDGVTPEFLKYLLSSAAYFYRSRSYLYYTKGLGIQMENGDMSVALITRNHAGQFGVAMSTLEDCHKPTECGSQSYLFADPSNIPFDDADLIERHGWDIAEDRYPLPMIHTQDGEMRRPTYDDLKWYEVVFRVIALFIKHTFSVPTFIPSGPLVYRCMVNSHAGTRSIIITAPPSKSTTVETVLHEPALQPPKEHLLHIPHEASKRSASRSSSATLNPLAPPPSVPWGNDTTSSPKLSAVSPTAQVPPVHSPSNRTDNNKATPSNPTNNVPTLSPTSTGDHVPLSPSSTSSKPIIPPTPSVDTLLPLFKSHEDTHTLKLKLVEQEKLNASLQLELDSVRDKLNWQIDHSIKQKDLVDQLQNRLRELEMSHTLLLREAETIARKDARDSKILIRELTSQSESLIQALANSEEEFKQFTSTMQHDTSIQRNKTISRLSKPKEKTVTPTATEVPKAKAEIKRRSQSAGVPSVPSIPSISRITSGNISTNISPRDSNSINIGVTPRSLMTKRSSIPADSPAITPRLTNFPIPVSARSSTNATNTQYGGPIPVPIVQHKGWDDSSRYSPLRTPRPQDLSEQEYLSDSNVCF